MFSGLFTSAEDAKKQQAQKDNEVLHANLLRQDQELQVKIDAVKAAVKAEKSAKAVADHVETSMKKLGDNATASAAKLFENSAQRQFSVDKFTVNGAGQAAPETLKQLRELTQQQATLRNDIAKLEMKMPAPSVAPVPGR